MLRHTVNTLTTSPFAPSKPRSPYNETKMQFKYYTTGQNTQNYSLKTTRSVCKLDSIFDGHLTLSQHWRCLLMIFSYL